MLRKYYVMNTTKFQVLIMAFNPLDAVAKAIEYCGFADSTEIPSFLMEWSHFTVDERGFRAYDAKHMVEVGCALDHFDDKNHYEEMGED